MEIGTCTREPPNVAHCRNYLAMEIRVLGNIFWKIHCGEEVDCLMFQEWQNILENLIEDQRILKCDSLAKPFPGGELKNRCFEKKKNILENLSEDQSSSNGNVAETVLRLKKSKLLFREGQNLLENSSINLKHWKNANLVYLQVYQQNHGLHNSSMFKEILLTHALIFQLLSKFRLFTAD